MVGSVIVDVAGESLTTADRERLLHPQCAGVILFTRNYRDLSQLKALTAQIKALRDPPLLISVDQEGGRVQRFREGFTPLPALHCLGEQYDQNPQAALQQARHWGYVMAAECIAAGIDFSYAPVLDVNYGVSEVIGDRALHRRPLVVIELAIAYIEGMRRAGMAAVGKHFPGHGGVAADSHTALPQDERDLPTIVNADLYVFAQLIRHGIQGLMPAHVIYTHCDDRPAGFSPYWLKTWLRERLAFEGVVFSDDLSMQAAQIAGSPAERAVAARAAGCDVVLVCNDPQAADEVLLALEDSPQTAPQRLAGMRAKARG